MDPHHLRISCPPVGSSANYNCERHANSYQS